MGSNSTRNKLKSDPMVEYLIDGKRSRFTPLERLMPLSLLLAKGSPQYAILVWSDRSIADDALVCCDQISPSSCVE